MAVSERELAKQRTNDRLAIVALIRVAVGLVATWGLICLGVSGLEYLKHPNSFFVSGLTGLMFVFFWMPPWVILHICFMRSKLGRYKWLVATVVPSVVVGVVSALLIYALMQWLGRLI